MEIKAGKDNAVEIYTQDHGPDGCDWSTEDALKHAHAHGWSINKFADPSEDALDGLCVAAAMDVMADDPSLIWLSR